MVPDRRAYPVRRAGLVTRAGELVLLCTSSNTQVWGPCIFPEWHNRTDPSVRIMGKLV
ncbi:rCG63396 [Rattus norvegicus]|uniref:RCG63396 n=1 Tax=Rattus norvegicus TaxID=10116 RepID=A6J5L8_RAT|nr:rCG63396 [Rattus norvegicus]